MTLRERIDADLKTAMRAKDKVRLDTLRSMISQFMNKKIEAGEDLSESQQIEVVRKLIKQRNDSIVEFQKAERTDLVDKETAERDILKEYVPAEMDVEAVRTIVKATLAGLDAGSRTEGAAMKALMPQLKGKVDGAVIRTVLLEELQAAN